MSFDPAAIALLNQANAAYAASKASSGTREWPPVGTHDCTLIGVTVKATEYEYNKVKVPAADVFFEYSWLPNDPQAADFDPTRTEPLDWPGARIRVIPGYESNPNLKDGQKTGLRIDMERLKGAITKILRKSEQECTNVFADLDTIAKELADTTRQVLVQVRITHRTYKDREGKDAVDRKENIVDRIS